MFCYQLKKHNDELSRVAEEKAHLDGVVQSLLKVLMVLLCVCIYVCVCGRVGVCG